MMDTPPFIHADARVGQARIGAGSKIWQFVIILDGAEVGADCNINALVLIEGDVVIGDRVTVKSGVQLWSGLRVGDDVFIGPNATFTNDLLPRSRQYPQQFARTVLGKGCSIGANATIVAGINIGEGAMIGAGSVVTHDVGPYELWYGNPARCKGRVDSQGRILQRTDVTS